MEVQSNGVFYKDFSSSLEFNKENTNNGFVVERKRRSAEDLPNSRRRAPRRNSVDRRTSSTSPRVSSNGSLTPSQPPSDYGSASERISAEHAMPSQSFTPPPPLAEDPIGWPSWLLNSAPSLPHPKRHLQEHPMRVSDGSPGSPSEVNSPGNSYYSPEVRSPPDRRRREYQRVDRYIPPHRLRSHSDSSRRERLPHSRGGSETRSSSRERSLSIERPRVTPTRVGSSSPSEALESVLSPLETVQHGKSNSTSFATSTQSLKSPTMKIGDLCPPVDVKSFPLGKGLLVGSGWQRNKQGARVPLDAAEPLPLDPRGPSYLVDLERQLENLSLHRLSY